MQIHLNLCAKKSPSKSVPSSLCISSSLSSVSLLFLRGARDTDNPRSCKTAIRALSYIMKCRLKQTQGHNDDRVSHCQIEILLLQPLHGNTLCSRIGLPKLCQRNVAMCACATSKALSSHTHFSILKILFLIWQFFFIFK